ncbi:MAG: lactonase family protein [Rubrivivax sp.]
MAGQPRFAYIGSRTTRERNARGDGITVCRVGDDGSLAPVQVLGDTINPSFLALNAPGDRLYTVHGDGESCSVFAVQAQHGTLTTLQTQACEGRNPVHLALDPAGAHLIVSNHLSGELASLPVLADGRLAPVAQRVALPGAPGPHRSEQPFSKPHHNPFDPSGRFVVVPDKGLDRIFVFRCDGGRLLPAAVPHVDTREAAGPRHVVFHPSGRWLYAINELDSTLVAYAFDGRSGALTPLQWLPTLPAHFTGNSRAAEVAIGADGRTLYASNRGCDSIEVFAIDAASGWLRHIQSQPAGGRTPRFFALHPAGGWLYVLNEDSDSVVTLRVAAADGRLSATGSALRCGSPVCLVFGG